MVNFLSVFYHFSFGIRKGIQSVKICCKFLNGAADETGETEKNWLLKHLSLCFSCRK